MICPSDQKFLVFGSLTTDLFVRPTNSCIISQISESDRTDFLAFPHGGKIIADRIQECFGGGASNVAISLSKLGFPASAGGAIGDDEFAARILQNLEENVISYAHVQRVPETKSGFSIIINSFDGERTVIYTSGANAQFSEYDEDIFSGITGIYLCHLSTPFFPSFHERINRYLEEHPGTFFAWNPGREIIEKGISENARLLAATKILFLNREEAEIFAGVDSQRKDSHGEKLRRSEQYCEMLPSDTLPDYAYDVSHIAKEFLSVGVETVVITDGRRGSQIFHQGNSDFYFCPIDEREKRIDTLGAGDAFSSAFCAMRILGKDLPSSSKYATIAAASVVSRLGSQAGLLNMESMEERFLSSPISSQKIPFPSF